LKKLRAGRILSVCIAVLMAGAGCVSATYEPGMGDAEIAKILLGVRERHQVPAMAAALVTSGGLQKVAAVGVRKRGTQVQVTMDDLWHLGSDTKIMTASLAAIMIEQGKLRWTSTVSEIFPERTPSFDPHLRDVSLLQLLSHRAGIAANLDYAALQKFGSVHDQRLEAVKEGLSGKPVSSPGSEFLYSNLGYIIAGAMIERVSGEDWETGLRTYIFSPLAMDSAGFGGLGTPGKIDQPWGHGLKGQPADRNGPDADNPPVLGPAGRVHCTIQDWARFATDQLRGARGEPALLKPEFYGMLQTTHFGGDYALGWGGRTYHPIKRTTRVISRVDTSGGVHYI